MSGAVGIREVGPRDGLQIEDPVSTDATIEFIDALVRTGVRAQADAEAVAAQLRGHLPGCGPLEVAAGLFVRVDDGHISRIDEYVDSAAIAPLCAVATAGRE